MFLKCKNLLFLIFCIILNFNCFFILKQNVIAEEIKIIDVYSGPGYNYKSIEKINESKIEKYLNIENGWYEVEFSNKRGYINKNDISKNVNVPHVYDITYISKNIEKMNPIYNINKEIILTCDVNLYYGPNNNYKNIKKVVKGSKIKLLHIIEDDSLVKTQSYYQIETIQDNDIIRGYATYQEIFDLNNPLKDFEFVKKNNGTFRYNKNLYYLDCEPYSYQWKQTNNFNVIDTDFNWINAMVGAMLSNDSGESTSQVKIPELQVRKGSNYVYAKTDPKSSKAKMDSFIDVIGMVNSAIQSGENSLILSVKTWEYQNEKILTIKTGEPIEKALAGKNISLSELSNQIFVNEDKWIREAFPELYGKGTYSMKLHFSNYDEYKDDPYGFNILVDNNKDIYFYPIIYSGTTMKIYYSENGVSEFVMDVAPILASTALIVSDEESERILNALAEKGIIYFDKNNFPENTVEFNGHHYYVSDKVLSWNDAKEYCEDMGGHLVTITSKDENIFLSSLDSTHKVGHWIGGNDIEVEGKWVWITGESFDYTNWDNAEPNNGGGVEDYLVLRENGTWNDGYSHVGKMGFICEWEY